MHALSDDPGSISRPEDSGATDRKFTRSRLTGAAVSSAAALLVFLLVTAGFVRWRTSAIEVDDAFITYRYARNLLDGHGPVYNPGERVEGYTSALWMLVSAAALRAGWEPLQATRAVGVTAYLASIALCGIIVFRSFGGGWRGIAFLPYVLLLVIPHGVASMAGTGMETYLAGSALLAMGFLTHVTQRRALFSASAGACGVIAVLTRPEALLGIIALAVSILAVRRGGSPEETTGRRQILWWCVALPVAAVSLLMAWRYSYYGLLLPNTYYAKAADQWNLIPGARYVIGYIRNSPHVVILAILAGYGVWRARDTAWRWSVFLIAVLLLWTGYVVKVGGDFMYYRFMFEVYPLLLCSSALGLSLLVSRQPWWTVGAALTALALSTTAPFIERKYGMHSPEQMDAYTRQGETIGKKLGLVLPADTIIATTLAGTIPYYSRLETVDEWGLNDRFVASLPANEPGRRGHRKLAPDEYQRERGVNIHIHHPVLCSCAKPCLDRRPSVLIRIEGDECLFTDYVVQRAELTEHFCSKPSEFILQGVSCRGR